MATRYRTYTAITLCGGAAPTYSADKKSYLVSPEEYTFNEYSGTVTFTQTQDPAAYIYVTIGYPYLRASNVGNTLYCDCHAQVTHKDANCLVCHTAHNTDNMDGIRGTVRTPDRSEMAVVFLRYTGINSFADGDGTHDGICEVCHTQTLYYGRDGSLLANHTSTGQNYDGMDCTACHSHYDGFGR